MGDGVRAWGQAGSGEQWGPGVGGSLLSPRGCASGGGWAGGLREAAPTPAPGICKVGPRGRRHDVEELPRLLHRARLEGPHDWFSACCAETALLSLHLGLNFKFRGGPWDLPQA